MSDIEAPFTITIKEASRLSGISRSSLYRLLVSEKIIAFKQGRTTLISVGSLRDYVSSLPVAEFRVPPTT